MEENCISYKTKPSQGHTEERSTHGLHSTHLESGLSILISLKANYTWQLPNLHLHLQLSYLKACQVCSTCVSCRNLKYTMFKSDLPSPPQTCSSSCLFLLSLSFLPPVLVFLPTRNNLGIWKPSFTLLSYSSLHTNSDWIVPILLSLKKKSNLISLFHSS